MNYEQYEQALLERKRKELPPSGTVHSTAEADPLAANYANLIIEEDDLDQDGKPLVVEVRPTP
jgi:hypothetical protein